MSRRYMINRIIEIAENFISEEYILPSLQEELQTLSNTELQEQLKADEEFASFMVN